MSQRIADCRGRLRRSRATRRIRERASALGTRREALELSGAFGCGARAEEGETRAAEVSKPSRAEQEDERKRSASPVEDGEELMLLRVGCGAEKEAEA